jgi:hypothetical protein
MLSYGHLNQSNTHFGLQIIAYSREMNSYPLNVNGGMDVSTLKAVNVVIGKFC